MSTPEGQQPPSLPTPQDIQAIFNRADEAARRAETAAQRLEAAQTGASEATRERWPDMPQEVVDQITKATAEQVVQALNAQYELGQQPPASPPATSSGTASPSSDAGTPSDGTASLPPASAVPGADSPPPAFRNLAHRVLGY